MHCHHHRVRKRLRQVGRHLTALVNERWKKKFLVILRYESIQRFVVRSVSRANRRL